MENNFKIGDKVRCIDNKHEEDQLTVGSIYTVNYATPDTIDIEGSVTHFLVERFELVSSISEIKNEVVKPSHYNQGKIEVLDFILDQKLDFPRGNVVKYVCRAKHKGKELEDLKKARAYLDTAIKELEK